MAALSGMAIGATAGGIAGGLIGLGIPELEARRYEGKIKEDNILISVHTENSKEIERTKEISARQPLRTFALRENALLQMRETWIMEHRQRILLEPSFRIS